MTLLNTPPRHAFSASFLPCTLAILVPAPVSVYRCCVSTEYYKPLLGEVIT
ncbi:hypothetical protein E2C01_095760 [Portunus trituberculatus]|uniref:Uncharacterized protein n=1 Tax=Portunus trituberculatus TaxID=210409 RepID=A0A5B7K4V9_PORTR|nr:hypothetical protein [Portunus trituberculatus]